MLSNVLCTKKFYNCRYIPNLCPHKTSIYKNSYNVYSKVLKRRGGVHVVAMLSPGFSGDVSAVLGVGVTVAGENVSGHGSLAVLVQGRFLFQRVAPWLGDFWSEVSDGVSDEMLVLIRRQARQFDVEPFRWSVQEVGPLRPWTLEFVWRSVLSVDLFSSLCDC